MPMLLRAKPLKVIGEEVLAPEVEFELELEFDPGFDVDEVAGAEEPSELVALVAEGLSPPSVTVTVAGGAFEDAGEDPPLGFLLMYVQSAYPPTAKRPIPSATPRKQVSPDREGGAC